MKYIVKRYLYVDALHTKTTFIKKTFDNYEEATQWAECSKGKLNAGAEVIDQETGTVLFKLEGK